METSKAISSAEVNVHSHDDVEARIAPADEEVADWARRQVHQELAMIIRKIWRRARAHRLDRGLTLSLPYFDDGAMELRRRELEVIPRGRIMFVPAFVVLAARQEKERVAGEAGLTEATRHHLMGLLEVLESEFGGSAGEDGGRPTGDR